VFCLTYITYLITYNLIRKYDKTTPDDHLAAEAAEINGRITGRVTGTNNYHSLASVTVLVPVSVGNGAQ